MNKIKSILFISTFLTLLGNNAYPMKSDEKSYHAKYLQEYPLHQACKDRDLDTFNKLIEQNYDINKQDTNGKTALHCAIEEKNSNVSTILNFFPLKTIMPIFKIRRIKEYCISSAPTPPSNGKNKMKIIKKLLELKADPNIQDERGYTPLHYAAKNENFKIILALEKSGIDFAIKTNSKELASELARKQKYLSLSSYLQEKEYLSLYNPTQNDNCVICLKKFTDDSTIAVLKCGHAYHDWCIQENADQRRALSSENEYLQYKETCPLCRTKIDNRKDKLLVPFEKARKRKTIKRKRSESAKEKPIEKKSKLKDKVTQALNTLKQMSPLTLNKKI